MSAGLSLDFFSTALVAVRVADHQSRGFCSDQPGLGEEIACSAMAVARTLPSSSQMRVLVPLVPMSMPRRWGMVGVFWSGMVGMQERPADRHVDPDSGIRRLLSLISPGNNRRRLGQMIGDVDLAVLVPEDRPIGAH